MNTDLIMRVYVRTTTTTTTFFWRKKTNPYRARTHVAYVFLASLRGELSILHPNSSRHVKGACYDRGVKRYTVFWRKWFLNDGYSLTHLNQIVGNAAIFFLRMMILVVIPRPWDLFIR